MIYGSQTGTAEGLAKKLVKVLKRGNFTAEIHDMASYDRTRLANEQNLLIITSTYGDGEPPDSAADLHGWLMSHSAPPDLTAFPTPSSRWVTEIIANLPFKTSAVPTPALIRERRLPRRHGE